MRGKLHHDQDQDDGDDAPEPDSFEVEGIQAFNRLAGAVTGLESRLGVLEHGLGSKATQAERAASKAETAAVNANQTAEHAEATARASARSAASWAVLGAVAGLLGAGGAGYWLGHSSGRENGLADGYRTALDQNAAASWANTPNGQLALALDRAGSLSMLAQCTNQNWKAETRDGRRFCFPMPDAKQNVTGWRLP